MPTDNIQIDGTGKFQQSTENAGAIKYGEFSQVSINTGAVAVSALFTGSAVNSGTIGSFLPYTTAVLVQSNSARWDAAFDAMGDFVFINDSRLSDARMPLAHTQPISSIEGFDDVVSDLQNQIGAAIASLSGGSAIMPDYPVTSVAGKTGDVTLQSSDISDFNTAVEGIASTAASNAVAGIDIAGTASSVIDAAAGTTLATLVDGKVPSLQLPSYVDDVLEYNDVVSFPATGETGKIYISITDNKSYRWSGSTYVEIAASPGSTDSVTEGSTNLYFTNARASAAAPVQSVAGKTGTVTLSSSDIQGLSAAVVAYTPAQLVQSVAGRTGSIVISASDVVGLAAQITSGSAVASVAGKTGVVTLSSSDVQGLSAAVVAYTPAQAVTSVAGKTGVITLSTSDIQGFNTNTAAQAPVQSVAGKTGTVSLSASDISGLSAAVVAYAPTQTIQSVAGRTGSVTISASDVVGLAAQITSGSAVTSVAGKTGAVTLSSSDVQGLSAAVVAYAPTQAVTSVAGKTGTITLSTSDVQGFNTNAAAQAPVQSVAGRTGAVVLSASDVTNFNTATDARITAAAGVTIASLVGGLIPSAQLPSYVDDVLEYSAFASFPGTGETGKIYVDTTSKKIYRWSGSAYVEISPSPGSTDSVTEGTTNLYFTTARASAAAPVQSVAGKTGAVTLTVLDVVSAAPLSALPSTSSITSWNNTYTNVATTSATWNYTSSIVNGFLGGGISTGDVSIELGVNRTGNGNAYIDFHSSVGSDYDARLLKEPTVNGNFTLTNNGSGNMVFLHQGTGGIYFATGSTPTTRMWIGSDGNVGIGTGSPTAKLNVNGSIRTDGGGTLQLGRCDTVAEGGQIDFCRASDNATAWSIDIIGSDASPRLRFFTADEKMTILSNGTVGIGTSSPTYKLDVNGDTITRGWLRTTGNAGWYSETYGGGWYMTDGYFIRNYGSKALLMNADVRIDAAALLVNPTSQWGTTIISNQINGSYGYNGQVELAINYTGYNGGTTQFRDLNVYNGKGGSIAFFSASNGNVGIGTTSPAQKLSVVGDISSTGTITAANLSLASAMLSTFTTPVTASGDFLVVTVGTKQRLIRVWDFN